MGIWCWLFWWTMSCHPTTVPPSLQPSVADLQPKPKPVVAVAEAAPGLSPLAKRYARQIVGAWQQQWAVAESPATAFAQIQQESDFHCDAVSNAGALGCAQFMPATAAGIHAMLPEDVKAACPSSTGCPLDPNWAFAALTKYDRQIWLSWKEEQRWRARWELVLTGYNAGPGWAKRERAAGGACLRAPAACKETAGYLRNILDRNRPQYVPWFGDARAT